MRPLRAALCLLFYDSGSNGEILYLYAAVRDKPAEMASAVLIHAKAKRRVLVYIEYSGCAIDKQLQLIFPVRFKPDRPFQFNRIREQTCRASPKPEGLPE